jgi:hypothetical protein
MTTKVQNKECELQPSIVFKGLYHNNEKKAQRIGENICKTYVLARLNTQICR